MSLSSSINQDLHLHANNPVLNQSQSTSTSNSSRSNFDPSNHHHSQSFSSNSLTIATSNVLNKFTPSPASPLQGSSISSQKPLSPQQHHYHHHHQYHHRHQHPPPHNHYPSPSSNSIPTQTQTPPPLAPFQTVDFDEGVLRTLCGLECGLPLILDRLKQAVGTSREVSSFLKKRGQLEEEYGAKLAKLAKERLESYTHLGGELKSGSFARQFSQFLSTHERIGSERAEYGQRLNAIADELLNLSKEVERIRKANKDVSWRLEKNLSESEGLTEKAKAKFDVTVEELERVLISKSGEHSNIKLPGGSGSGTAATNNNPNGLFNSSTLIGSSNFQKSGQAKVLGKAISKLTTKATRSAGHLAKMEDDMRNKMSNVSDVYRAQVLATQQVRQEYFNLQLPRILRTLKENSDEMDLAIQYYLTNYSCLSESLLVNEALAVSAIPSQKKQSPKDSSGNLNDKKSSGSVGLKDLVQEIDNREDFKEYMSNYAAHFNQTHHLQLNPQPISYSTPHTTLPHSSGLAPITPLTSAFNPSTTFLHQQPHHRHSLRASPGAISPRTSVSSTVLTNETKKTFGVDLATQMLRDGIETVPKVVEKCIEAIERAGGLEMVGIYRLSGTTSKIARLKSRFDTEIENVKLEVGDENQSEINDIAGVLKLWLRELPEPLLTWNLYSSFIEAGRIDNDRLRHIRLHERVNELPDPNYATLKYLMGHLDKIRRNETVNSMGVSNLAVIFGPTLLSPPPIGFYQQAYNTTPSQQLNPHNGSLNVGNLIGNQEMGQLNGSNHHNGSGAGGSALQDMSAQCKVVETILEHYREIFVEEEDNEEEEEIEMDKDGKDAEFTDNITISSNMSGVVEH
ncbi:hypothetical protein O181_030876 [Austropuccinia psidii MF-1]|uniref:Rho-GAP domain-containing protein n=1 Tax=Austropuccinia psidii MF-1 TaxID=1389203 RepID=A0A9Q3CTS7_9BASI|nr:hypothetical protein [Austropuccinia psidii MF-1]